MCLGSMQHTPGHVCNLQCAIRVNLTSDFRCKKKKVAFTSALTCIIQSPTSCRAVTSGLPLWNETQLKPAISSESPWTFLHQIIVLRWSSADELVIPRWLPPLIPIMSSSFNTRRSLSSETACFLSVDAADDANQTHTPRRSFIKGPTRRGDTSICIYNWAAEDGDISGESY